MQLYLLRHGDAVEGCSDQHRQLSAYGREQVECIAFRHGVESEAIEQVLSSPYARAVETAKIFTCTAKLEYGIDYLDDLRPEGDLRAIEAFLQRTHAETLLMVSHLPLVGLLIEYLTGERGTRMGTANLASLSMKFPAQGNAILNWIHHVN
jgi:phosphohistidine phosphatase